MALARPPLFASGLDSFPTTAELPSLPAMSYTSKQDRVSLEWLTAYVQMRRSHGRPRSAWGLTDDVQSSSVQHRFVSESNNKRTSASRHVCRYTQAGNLHYVVVC